MGRRGESVYRRKDGLWEARYVKEIGIDGKKRYGSVYGHSYREAKEKRQDVMDRIVLRQPVPPMRKITVNILADEWLFINQNRLKPATIQRYTGIVSNHIKPTIGGTQVMYLTTAGIHQFSLSRLDAGLAPQTVNDVLMVLRAILRHGYRTYHLPEPEIVFLSCEKKEMRVLSSEEQRLLTAHLWADMDIFKLGVLVALYTGLRIGELCALRWEDIDNSCIRVKGTVQRLKKPGGVGTELVIGSPKTESSKRIVPMPVYLCEMIEQFRPQSNEGYFLSSKNGDIVEPRQMQYKFQMYVKMAGIAPANFHALRHTFATRCVECGFEIKSLSEILGHTNVQTTLNKYVHSSFDLKRENMAKLALLL